MRKNTFALISSPIRKLLTLKHIDSESDNHIDSELITKSILPKVTN